jgi:hypothetical protein
MARITAVRVRNEGETNFHQRYAGEMYDIPPSVDMIIPYDAMVLWLGNPELVDIDRKRRFRTNEYARLCVKYGVYEREVELGEKNFPKLKAFTLTDNQPIITVLDDPEGKHITPELQTTAVNQRQSEQLALMAQEMDALRAQMAILTQRNGAMANMNHGDEDGAGRTETGEDRPEITANPNSVPTPDPTIATNTPLTEGVVAEPPLGGGATPDRPSTPARKPGKVTASV